VDAILAGWYRQFSMDALEAACDAVWQDARLHSCLTCAQSRTGLERSDIRDQ
jgi:hypothetical protein